jgi:hypothetical protein
MTKRDSTRHLNEWQWQQMAITTATLRAMNARAELELRRVQDRFTNRNDYREAGEMFAVLAVQINSTVSYREEVLTPNPATEPDIYLRVVFVDPLDKDLSTKSKKPEADREADRENALQVDPEHCQEVDELLEMGQRVSERVLARYKAQKVCSKYFFNQLSRLRNALQRQRRQLLQLYPPSDWSSRFHVSIETPDSRSHTESELI